MPVSTLLHKFHKMIHSIINSNFIIALYKPRHLITHSSHTVTVKRQSDKNSKLHARSSKHRPMVKLHMAAYLFFFITWEFNESLQEIF